MQENNKGAKINQILSAFLVIAYVVCMYYFSGLVANISLAPLQLLANIAMYVVFGLLLFYATRVGEGKQIRRFSLSVLLLMVLPGLYMVLAAFAPGLPLRSQIISSDVLTCLGYVMLGYGIPYTFFSGYELAPKEEDAADAALEPELPSDEPGAEDAAGEEDENTGSAEDANSEPDAQADPAEEAQQDEEKTPASSAK